MHLFGYTFDHDYYFELLREGGAGCSINSSMFYFTPSPDPSLPAFNVHCGTAFSSLKPDRRFGSLPKRPASSRLASPKLLEQ